LALTPPCSCPWCLQGLEGEELALCYFKDNKAAEPRGWVYAKDVTELIEDKLSITIVSPGRTLKLSAQTRQEHKLWLQGLRSICLSADFSSTGNRRVLRMDFEFVSKTVSWLFIIFPVTRA
jgi:hypothetical protein